MHRQCKLILHWQLIRMFQPSILYKKDGIKWGDDAENMIVISWQYKIILHYLCIFFFSNNKQHLNYIK
jgi:hypothetical protein